MASIPIKYYNRNDVERSYAIGKVIGYLDACACMYERPIDYGDFVDSLEEFIKEAFGDDVVREFVQDTMLDSFFERHNFPYKVEFISNPDLPNDQVRVTKITKHDRDQYTRQVSIDPAISAMSNIEPMIIKGKWSREDSDNQIKFELEQANDKGVFTVETYNLLASRISKLYNLGYLSDTCAENDDHWRQYSMGDINHRLALIGSAYRLRRVQKGSTDGYRVSKIK